MSLIAFICLGIFFLLLLTLFKKGTDVFSPGRLFLLIWLFVVGVTELKLSRYQISWSNYSWVMLLIALSSMLLGIFIVYVINYHRSMKKINSIRELVKNFSINSKLLFNSIIFLFTAYIVSYIVTYLVIGYIPFFTKYPGVARADWGIFGFGLFIQAFPSIIFLIILYFVCVKNQKRNKIILALIFIIVFFTYSFLLQRYYVIFAIILSTVYLYYSTKLLRLKNVLVVIGVVVLVIFSMTYIRLSGTIVNYLYYLSDMRYSVKYAIFTEPYMYIVMNLENFAHAVEKLEIYTYGTFTFDFVFALTGIKHPLIEYQNLPEFPFLITNNYNTYTMFFVYYWDYGIIGLGFIPMLLGMFFSNAYYKMRFNPNINTISLYAVFAFIIIFSFFVPIITFLHFIFNLLLIYGITKYISNKSETDLLLVDETTK